MPTRHVVSQGECLTTIAARYGFADAKVLCDLPENAALARTRPNPNVLFPGDVVVIPDRRPKTVTVAVGQTHKLIVTVPRKVLRLCLKDRDGTPLRNQATQVTFEDAGQKQSKLTNGDGRLELPVPPGAIRAKLEIAGRVFELRLGHLNPMADTPDGGLSGIQARLDSLGYGTGGERELGPATRQALALFQEEQGLEPTGEPDPGTLDKLRTAHGS